MDTAGLEGADGVKALQSIVELNYEASSDDELLNAEDHL